MTAPQGAGWPTSAGIIGAGAMGSAFGVGLVRAGISVSVHDAIPAVAIAAAERDGLSQASPAEVGAADLVCVAVKPTDGARALGEIAPLLGDDAVVMSMMAGWTLQRLEEVLPNRPVVRIMPNLAVRHGAGLLAVATDNLDDARLDRLRRVLGEMGTCVVLPESAFAPATALAGSGPGFVALIAEALEDGAVAAGLPRPQARRMVPAVLAGTAALLADGTDPATLRQSVSSPGGTTISGLSVMERGAVRAHVADAVRVAAQRALEL